ncbi:MULTISPECIES: hypothetical protein [unclassified Arthrobacter]|uniref:hypothetical protein n=1 Tax=unclassified Arthrobacter TaxID=235627 RepID=UPI0011B0772F|nr:MULTISPECIES: hypothetical protein [unclassified Arthrobacter]
MFETFDYEPVIHFDIPQDVSEARIISSFSGKITERQYIFTVKRVGEQGTDVHEFEELNWSSSLNSSFEYVSQLEAEATSLGKVFRLSPGIGTLEISCVEWKKPTVTSAVSITSLSLELFSRAWNYPAPFTRLIIPGRTI